MNILLSSARIPLLFYALKACLAAAAVPPILMSDFSLAVAPLQLPDNCTLSSNLNVTQQQQEVLQLFNSNQTSATNNVRTWKVTRAVIGTRYKLTVHGIDTYPRLTPLEALFEQVFRELQKYLDNGEGDKIPTAVNECWATALNPGRIANWEWFNQCNDAYGSYHEIRRVVKTLREILTVPGIMPTPHQSNRCIYAVTMRPEHGAEEFRIADGLVWGTSA